MLTRMSRGLRVLAAALAPACLVALPLLADSRTGAKGLPTRLSEQKFTYIAALKPAMAFIIDIRRANLDLHLMYKALFELSADRVEFVSRLFSRTRPEGLTERST